MKSLPFTTLSITWSFLCITLIAICQHYGGVIPAQLWFSPRNILGVLTAIAMVLIAFVLFFIFAGDVSDDECIIVPLSALALLADIVTLLCLYA